MSSSSDSRLGRVLVPSGREIVEGEHRLARGRLVGRAVAIVCRLARGCGSAAAVPGNDEPPSPSALSAHAPRLTAATATGQAERVCARARLPSA